MADAEGTRRLEAILAADVAGFSRLMQEDDEATVATLETYRAIFRERIQAHHGRVVDMAGDSVLAVFEAATEAVCAAFEIQSVLAERNQELPEPRRMRFRIGVNLGEVIEKPDGTVYGDGVLPSEKQFQAGPVARPGLRGICRPRVVRDGHANLDFARRFAEGIHRRYPAKLLAYNCSPSFNWKRNLDDATIAKFQGARSDGLQVPVHHPGRLPRAQLLDVQPRIRLRAQE
jgi:Adenylate and Guanylate cyclase catalytic domain/Isocitrate lyase family